MGLQMEHIGLSPGPDAPLPPQEPVTMPTQSLTRYDKRQRHRLRGEPSVRLARLALGLITILGTIFLTHQMYLVLQVGGLTGVERVMLALFVLNIAWIGFGSISPLMGFLLGAGHRPVQDAAPPGKKTALLMPTYNEDPARILGAAMAMMRAIERKGAGDAFDLFLLSDTNQARYWLAEEAMVAAGREDPEIGHRIFYRHRGKNLRRKAGNIEDWVERWGGAYPYMLVLDADSLMEADTIIELARRMEADDELGMLQTSPNLIGGETPTARVQQFASRVYGNVLTRGLRAWFGNAGNYWGHNCIIRTQAFAECAGLPELPGKPPFGGLILSHDFVEAALVRRGGWAVRMADDLPGSYEAAPPNLLELAARDRRWCQGNLQHTRLFRTAGFHPLSRLHLVMGVMSYLSSPLWLLFLLAGMSLALHAYLVPPDYFLDQWSLFPDWPRIDPERAMALFGLCMLVLYAPKLFGTAAFLRDRASRGLRFGTVFGLITEVILTALIAPIMMMVQTSSIAQIITGADSGWSTQSRDTDRVPWSILWQFHKRHLLAGLILAVAAGAISWRLLAWMSPAILGLVLAMPLSAFMGSARMGRALRRVGLLTTPEERNPPVLVAEAIAEAEMLRDRARVPEGLGGLLSDPSALDRHLAWADPPTARRPGEPDAALAGALLKLADGLSTDELDAKERYAVLASTRTLSGLLPREPVRQQA